MSSLQGSHKHENYLLFIMKIEQVLELDLNTSFTHLAV